jgi:hypothetical protein
MNAPAPLTIDDIRALMEARRQALMQELAVLNKRLGYGPRELATCPNCRKNFQHKVGG